MDPATLDLGLAFKYRPQHITDNVVLYIIRLGMTWSFISVRRFVLKKNSVHTEEFEWDN